MLNNVILFGWMRRKAGLLDSRANDLLGSNLRRGRAEVENWTTDRKSCKEQ